MATLQSNGVQPTPTSGTNGMAAHTESPRPRRASSDSLSSADLTHSLGSLALAPSSSATSPASGTRSSSGGGGMALALAAGGGLTQPALALLDPLSASAASVPSPSHAHARAASIASVGGVLQQSASSIPAAAAAALAALGEPLPSAQPASTPIAPPPAPAHAAAALPPSAPSPSLLSKLSTGSFAASLRASFSRVGGSGGSGSGGTVSESERAARREERHREWASLVSHWHEVQRMHSGSGSGGGGLVHPTREMRAKQRRVSELLFACEDEGGGGVPPHLRASVWLLTIGNELQLTPTLFEQLRSECAQLRVQYEAWRQRTNNAGATTDSPDATPPDPAWADFPLIDQDLHRTFPHLAFFAADGGPYAEPRRIVLECVSRWRAIRVQTNSAANGQRQPAFVQGMSHLASILLLAIGDDPFLTFVTLANLLENPLERLSDLFSLQGDALDHYSSTFDAQLTRSLPALASHFSNLSPPLQSHMFLYRWVLTVFAQSLPLDAVFRVWDVFLWESFRGRGLAESVSATTRISDAIAAVLGTGTPSSATADANNTSPGSVSSSSATSSLRPIAGQGFPFLFRVALALLKQFSSRLLSSNFEGCMALLQHLPGAAEGDEEAFDIESLFRCIKSIKMEPTLWGENFSAGLHSRRASAPFIVYSSPSPASTSTPRHQRNSSEGDYSSMQAER